MTSVLIRERMTFVAVLIVLVLAAIDHFSSPTHCDKCGTMLAAWRDSSLVCPKCDLR